MLREAFLFLVLSITVAAKQAAAQNIQAEIDSLTRVLGSAKEDTAKVSLLVAISRDYYNTDPAKGV